MSNSPRFQDSSLRIYLREINQYPLLNRAQEEELGARVAQGDREARDTMIRCNLRLVVRIAREYTRRGVPLADLVAEGNIGLMKAVERFDPNQGARFSTYATWWIRQTVRRALQTCGPTVRVPGYMIELISRWKRAREALTSRLSRTPTGEEMAAELDMSPKRVGVIRRALRAASTSPGSSPDMMWLFEDVLVDERNPSPDEALLEKSEHQMIETCLQAIDQREAEILRLHYGFDTGEPTTLQKIGERLGVTRERVRQLEVEALRKLAHVIRQFEHGEPLTPIEGTGRKRKTRKRKAASGKRPKRAPSKASEKTETKEEGET